MELGPQASTAGVRLQVYDSLDSTNIRALECARSGETGPLWIVARQQTAGRGRRGRRWISEPGNLYASLLLSQPSPSERAPELCFVAALAVSDAIAAVADDLTTRVALKWPNDVLLDGRKVAGILIEGEGSPLSAVIGIGVNCTHHPHETSYPATSLRAADVLSTPAALFAILSGALLRRLAQWSHGNEFAAIRTEWLARAARLGEAVSVVVADRAITGIFETIDEAGYMMLRLDNGSIERIAAGDVLARPAGMGVR